MAERERRTWLRPARGFLRWLFAGPWYSVTPQIALLGVAVWLMSGGPGPGRYDATPMLDGGARIAGLVAGTSILIGLAAYWQSQVRRDEPPRIKSRWDRRRG